jgi:hypothetical protein
MKTLTGSENTLHDQMQRAPSGRAGRAPQTLVVDAARPDAQLEQPVPLPYEISASLRLLPPNAFDVRVTGSSEGAAAPAAPPAVRMKSLPPAADLSPDASMIPKVNQISAAVAESGSATAPAGLAQQDAPPGKNSLSASTASGPPQPANPGMPAAPGVSAEAPLDAAAPLAKDPVRIEVNGARPPVRILAESQHIPGKIVSTIYLNMGLPRTWALEYWVNGDSLSGVTAPWPNTMLRPDITLPPNVDTLLIRARVAADGCLEDPKFVADIHSVKPDPILRSLELWRFRPAMKNGQPIAVEILLVIPRQDAF